MDATDNAVHPRIQLAAIWASVMLLFAYVDLFSLYRPDIRADLDAGKIFVFDVGQPFLLGVTVYVGIASLMVAWCAIGPARAVRWSNLVLAPIYIITIVGGAIGEWWYYVAGSVAEAVLLIIAFRIASRWSAA